MVLSHTGRPFHNPCDPPGFGCLSSLDPPCRHDQRRCWLWRWRFSKYNTRKRSSRPHWNICLATFVRTHFVPKRLPFNHRVQELTLMLSNSTNSKNKWRLNSSCNAISLFSVLNSAIGNFDNGLLYLVIAAPARKRPNDSVEYSTCRIPT